MRLTERPRRRPTINITSLIDVLFLLLTFFLVTTTFIEQSALKVELPSMQHSDRVSREKRFLLEVSSDGQMRYDDKWVNAEVLGARLKAEAEEINTGGGLTLRADQSLAHGKVIAILDLIKGAGVRRFVIATAEAGGRAGGSGE
jgi:biopolymer transport protein ExbD